MGAGGGEHRIGTHRLGVCPRRGCGRLPVIHGHHIDAVERHAGSEGGPHHVQAIGSKTIRQDGERVPDLQAGPSLLEDLQGIAAERDCGGIGHRRSLDIEIEAVERVGIDDASVGLRQVGRSAAMRCIPLGEARARRPAERDHHVTAGGLERPDRLVDRDGLLVGGIRRKGRDTRPGRCAIRSGLDEAQRDERHAPRAGDLHQVRHGPHPHVHVRGEVGLAPLLVAGVARVEPTGWKRGSGSGGRRWSRRRCGSRRRRRCVGEHAGDISGGGGILAGEVGCGELCQRHALEAVGLLHCWDSQDGAARLIGEPQFAAGEPVEGEDVGCGIEVGDREVLVPRPGDREGTRCGGHCHGHRWLGDAVERGRISRAGRAHGKHHPGFERLRGESDGRTAEDLRDPPPMAAVQLPGRQRTGEREKELSRVHVAPP